ncbi:DUF262 domain-containing protein [Pseudonocardia phyllosphaerae]|uniref:DUF262 domain-containing protein n=1 Tax=Pseudonocardia phyllosphaerae TaxID=3390502 RepID=UPI00397E2B8F
MKADTLSLKQLFQRDVRYVIPTFQRPYVWNQDDQWEPLWEDVRNASERYLTELDALGGDAGAVGAKAEERVGRHFMGAVVLQQRPNAAAELETRDVIDGQQRLTTMQLLADAAQQVAEDDGFAKEAKRLSRIVVNQYADGDDEFKLWPTRLDRDAFRAVMRNGADTTAFEASRIAQAHEFFRLQIREWINSVNGAERARLVHGLETTLFALVQLVVIDLSTDDDAAVIFETLNARGTPLLASDLVKNYVLQAATTAGLDADALHTRHWEQLETEWWRTEIRQGRLFRPRLDNFLGHWLVMRTATEVQSHDVFPRFREYVENAARPIDEVVADVARIAAVYRTLETEAADPSLARFLYRWHTIEAGVATPALLWLLSAPEIATEARDRALTAIESFLVRRMLCRLTTKDYNRLFLDLLERLHADPTLTEDPVVTFFAEQEADSREWPDDSQLTAAFTELPLFRLLTRNRLRMVLEALELSLRGRFAESMEVPRNLTVEHVLPRAWTRNWPPPVGDDQHDAIALRNRLLHSVGNLTLLNGKLNSAQSNGPWTDKQRALDQHSVLYLNKRLLDRYRDAHWDEEAIRDRGVTLAEQAAAVWPSAKAMVD